MKSSIRKLRRRFHRRDTNKDGTSTKTGDAATGVVKPGQENNAGDDGLNHQGESVVAAITFEASTPSEYEIRSHVQEKPATVSWSQYYSEHRDEILEGFKTFFSIGDTIAGAIPFPGSDIIFGALASFVERVQIIGENSEMKEKLRSRISDLKFTADPNFWPQESLLALQSFESQITEQLHPYLKRIDQRGHFTKFFLANVDKARFEELDACVTKAIQRLSMVLIAGNTTTLGRITTTTARIEDGVNAVETKVDAQALQNIVDKLPKLATYDSQRPRPIDVCYGETCNAILEEIKAWAEEDGQPQMMWISGLAGTGKSTIAKTIATWAAEKGILGGSYFFSRDMMELRKSSHVIPSIAYHLSVHDDSLAKYISMSLVERNGHVLNQEITEQFKRLIEEPLRLVYVPRKRTLLVIDGIDECDNPKDVETIIHHLSSLFSSPDVSNAHIHILLVSRPERHIRDALHAHDQLVLRYSVEDFVETSDIEEYLWGGLSSFGRSDWPSDDDFFTLVDSCGKLFIYASTVLGFIGDGRALRTPEESLQIILNIKSDGALDDMPYKQLDDLYSRILLEAVGNNAKAESKRMVRFRKILGTIVLLRDPLGVSSLSKLIEEKEQQIWNTLNHLSSILIVPPEEDSKTPVRFFHPSLLDHLIDVTRCNERFFIDVPHLEAHLFQRCVDIIVSKGLLGTVDEDFIPVMRYVCGYWGYHLEKVHDETAQAVAKLDEFVRHHLLKWFRFARVLLQSCGPLFQCMEVTRNWALAVCDLQCKFQMNSYKKVKSDCNSELLETLDNMLRSFRVLDDGLPDYYEATYDATRSKCGDEETQRDTCYPGTRVAVLDEIKEWVTSECTGPMIFWVHGSALTGKSAVAMSIAEWADEKGILCGGFFCCDVFETSGLTFIVGTISHDLASFDIAMRGHVVEALERNKDLRSSEDLELQFNALIAKPLLSLKQAANRQVPILLIVDGLEWCEGATELLSLLTLFFTHLSGPDTSHIRILITSRPTPNICNAFEKYKGLHKSVNLDEVSAVVVRQDIETYLYDGLAQIHETLSLPNPPDWPDRTGLDSLVINSRNSFLYAKYALKFIGDSKVRNPADQLRNWLAKQCNGKSFEDMYPRWIVELGAPPVRLLVIAMCVSQEPVPLASLAELLQMDANILRTTLPHLYPFVVSDTDDGLRASHPSLRDFYMNSELLAEQHAAELCCHCLRIMNEGLTIVFEDPNRTNQKEDERDTMFRPALRYACRYWATILSKATDRWQNGDLSLHFDTFIRNHLLSWFYAMALNLLQLASESASMMGTAYAWSKDNNLHPGYDDAKVLTEEAWHFAEDNQQAFAESPLQVYRAVLDLPEDSKLRRTYKAEAEERLRAFEVANCAGAPDGDIPSQC